jgi:hypothetical protein
MNEETSIQEQARLVDFWENRHLKTVVSHVIHAPKEYWYCMNMKIVVSVRFFILVVIIIHTVFLVLCV